MATISSTARGLGGTANPILSNRIVIDMSKEIAMLRPKYNPLTVLTKKLNTKACSNYKFEWMEDSILARWVSANNGGGYASDATSIALHSGEGSYVAVGDLLKVVTSGEILLVTAKSTDTLTVTRGYGDTAADTIANDGAILVLGNASMQGSGAPAEKYNNPTATYNYTQIFKTPFSVVNTLEAVDLYGDSELARLRRKKGEEHAMSLEYAFLFGEKKLDTTGEQVKTTTQGLYKALIGTANYQTITKSSGTQVNFDTALEPIFTYGSGTKTALCSPSFITWFNQLAQGKVQIINADNDKTFGLDILSYITPHGKLNMIAHPLLVSGYTDMAFILDMENIAYRPLKGRDTQFKTNIQSNDEDGERDMYITECGLEVRLPLTHGIIKLT